MYCILNKNIALRSWWLVPYAFYRKNTLKAEGLKKEEFELLLKCDGVQEIPEDEATQEIVTRLIMRGLVEPCKKGEVALTDWQKHLDCDNRYFPAMNWMITGKCNFNCLHCFNAADNAPLMSEFTLEEANKLLDEAQKCGINTFTITGGEPMLHKNFFDIIKGIYDRGMYVQELNTNGQFINEEALERMKEIGCRPLMKISFDGIGHHDWLRNKKGAEEDALRAIKLCIEKGFEVMVQTNVHRGNYHTMLPTAELMDTLGVANMRIIRTTEAPRWVQNGGDSTLGLEEYFDLMLEFIKGYTAKPHNMDIEIWQFMTLYSRAKMFGLRGVECSTGEYRDNIPVCRGNRGLIAVAANGNVFPCHQMSGYYEAHNDFLGNVKQGGLQPLLRSGKYLSEVCTTVGMLAKENTKCGSCKYFKHCVGGCRAIGLALTGNKMGEDLSKCIYWFKGYHKKIEDALPGYRNRTPYDVD